jgi:hypothetical protein
MTDNQDKATVTDISPPRVKPAITPCYRISVQAAGIPHDILQGVGVDSKESVMKVAQAHAARLQQQWEEDAKKRGHPRGSRPRVRVWKLIGTF